MRSSASARAIVRAASRTASRAAPTSLCHDAARSSGGVHPMFGVRCGCRVSMPYDVCEPRAVRSTERRNVRECPVSWGFRAVVYAGIAGAGASDPLQVGVRGLHLCKGFVACGVQRSWGRVVFCMAVYKFSRMGLPACVGADRMSVGTVAVRAYGRAPGSRTIERAVPDGRFDSAPWWGCRCAGHDAGYGGGMGGHGTPFPLAVRLVPGRWR